MMKMTTIKPAIKQALIILAGLLALTTTSAAMAENVPLNWKHANKGSNALEVARMTAEFDGGVLVYQHFQSGNRAMTLYLPHDLVCSTLAGSEQTLLLSCGTTHVRYELFQYPNTDSKLDKIVN